MQFSSGSFDLAATLSSKQSQSHSHSQTRMRIYIYIYIYIFTIYSQSHMQRDRHPGKRLFGFYCIYVKCASKANEKLEPKAKLGSLILYIFI